MSERLDRAIAFATKAHAGQMRKGNKLPYIIHPMETASIVAHLTDSEDVMIAALLHDTVEDASMTLDEIEAEFGKYVRDLVASETEDKMPNLPPESTWQVRKEESLKVLRDATDINVKILWLGDKLANLRSFDDSHYQTGDEIFEHLHQKDKKMQKWYYDKIIEYLEPLSKTICYFELIYRMKFVFGE